MKAHTPELVKRVMDLHREGLTGLEIAKRVGLKRRDQANYIIRLHVGPRPRPKAKLIDRKCERCGKIDKLPPWRVKQAKNCRECAHAISAASNKAAHTHKWTKAVCRWCRAVFPIYKSALEEKWRKHHRRFPNAVRRNFKPFCCRGCYDAWQRNGWKKKGSHRH